MQSISNQRGGSGWGKWTNRTVAVAVGTWMLLAGRDATGQSHRGQSLFERSDWRSRSGSFNAESCVACHHLGGVGGAGDERFNARSVGIESLRLPGRASDAELKHLLASLHPDFVDQNGVMTTVISVPHFPSQYVEQIPRTNLLAKLDGRRDRTGGPANHVELLKELASTIQVEGSSFRGTYEITAKAFQRNTPALFGVGLIDAVSEQEIRRAAQMQRRHTAISGRPATLPTGEIGRFGWRANVATLLEFTSQACANELGLSVQAAAINSSLTDEDGFHAIEAETPKKTDVLVAEVKWLTEFMRSLPPPGRSLPTEPEALYEVTRGEKIFESIGCSVCHQPTIGPAVGVYSDLLLHDMGEDLRDPNQADAYVVRYGEFVSRPTIVSVTASGYYGAPVPLSIESQQSGSASQNSASRGSTHRPLTITRPYQKTPNRLQAVPVAVREFTSVQVTDRSGRSMQATARQVKFRRNTIRPTSVSQEWRTPPLWGLRDTAPYMHDGRAATVKEAILLHAGEGRRSRDRYRSLNADDRDALLAFLDTFTAPADATMP